MYHFNNAITHPDSQVADKANFFADVFEFVATDLGKLGAFELENHKSLLEKVLTQLENHTKHSKKYVNYYFGNPYLSRKDPLIKKYYAKEWKLIATQLNKYNETNDPQVLYGGVKDLVRELDKSLFANALNEITTALQCRLPLSKHGHVNIIEYNTPLLVSEFVFAGFDSEQLSILFKNIFAKDISFDGAKVKTQAPLPPELIDLKAEPVKFFEAAREYLKNRNLRQQFEGIYYLFKNAAKERTFIFRLNDVRTYDTFRLDHSGVSFSNNIRKEYVKKGNKKEFASFFRGTDRIFASVKIRTGDESTSLNHAIRQIQKALDFFKATLAAQAQLTTDDYVVCDDESCTRVTELPRTIHPDIAKKAFDRESISAYLKNTDTRFAKRVEASDAVYYQALGSKHPDDKLVNFWRYLESFFDQADYRSEDVKEKVAELLSLTSRIHIGFVALKHAGKVMYSDAIGLRPERFGVTREELWQLLHPEFIVDSNFRRMNEIINHPYVNRILGWQITASNGEKREIAYRFYSKVLNEAYEQRNLIEHCGLSNGKAVDKAILTLPDLVAEFRRTIATKVSSGATSIDEVICMIESDYNK